MRGFLFGLLLLVAGSVTVLSLRPGGFRRQLRLAGRRFRIVLALGGVYLLGSGLIRVFVPPGPVLDYGPPAIAIVLAVVYVLVAGDPPDTGGRIGA